MKSFFKFLIVLISILLSNTQFAQLDNNNSSKGKGQIKGMVLNNSNEIVKPKSLNLDGSEGFKKAFDKEKEKLRKQKKEDDLKNKGILTKELYRKIRFKKFIEKNTLQIPMIDKDIGVFETKSVDINLFCFDFGRLDGDKVTILKNGKTYKENITLLGVGKNEVIKIPLDKGFNKIEILAVNEGNLRPNTGAFTLFDNFKEEVFSDFWQLAKGAKVIAHIIRIEK